MSIRLRLTLWYTFILAITLVAFSVLLYTTLDRVLRADVDTSLKTKAEDISRAIRVRGDIFLTQPRVTLPQSETFASPTFYIQLIDRSGQVVEHSDNLGDATLPVDPAVLEVARLGEEQFVTVQVGSEPVRLYLAPVLANNEVVGFIGVGRPLQTIESTFRRLQVILIGINVLSLLVTAGVGWLLARAVLSPIDRITQTARGIGQGQKLDLRLKPHPQPDEIGRLIETFNQMLERIETSFVAQRRFVADASHELRTPLTTIRGNVDLLRRNGHLTEADRQEALADIASETERMYRITHGLLALARADAGRHLERASVDLASVLNAVYRQVQPLAQERGIGLSYNDGRLPPLATQVLGNADALQELVLVLVDNALKYTPSPGAVRLSLGREGRSLVITVSDTGVGIEPTDLPHIFDRFYRGVAARQMEGTGLGLAIARWIADEHGGRIQVESEPGKGSTFTVWLPAQLG